MTERDLTVFTRYPEVASPTRRRVTACVAESLNKTTLVAGLRIVPINFRAGRSGGAGAAAAGACAGWALAWMAGAGGRREREKSGRSRVAVRTLSGIFESGLPACVASLRLDEGVARAGSIGAADAGAARARPRRRMYLTSMRAASLGRRCQRKAKENNVPDQHGSRLSFCSTCQTMRYPKFSYSFLMDRFLWNGPLGPVRNQLH